MSRTLLLIVSVMAACTGRNPYLTSDPDMLFAEAHPDAAPDLDPPARDLAPPADLLTAADLRTAPADLLMSDAASPPDLMPACTPAGDVCNPGHCCGMTNPSDPGFMSSGATCSMARCCATGYSGTGCTGNQSKSAINCGFGGWQYGTCQ